MGINVAGMCCTGNEILMRHGVPVAGNFLQQELAVATGAVEAMVVDIQCIMPALGALAGCFTHQVHLHLPQGQVPGAIHMEFHEQTAMQTAKAIAGGGPELCQPKSGQGAYPQHKDQVHGRLLRGGHSQRPGRCPGPRFWER